MHLKRPCLQGTFWIKEDGRSLVPLPGLSANVPGELPSDPAEFSPGVDDIFSQMFGQLVLKFMKPVADDFDHK